MAAAVEAARLVGAGPAAAVATAGAVEMILSSHEDCAVRLWDCRSPGAAALLLRDAAMRDGDKVGCVKALGEHAYLAYGSQLLQFDLRRGDAAAETFAGAALGLSQEADETLNDFELLAPATADGGPVVVCPGDSGRVGMAELRGAAAARHSTPHGGQVVYCALGLPTASGGQPLLAVTGGFDSKVSTMELRSGGCLAASAVTVPGEATTIYNPPFVFALTALPAAMLPPAAGRDQFDVGFAAASGDGGVVAFGCTATNPARPRRDRRARDGSYRMVRAAGVAVGGGHQGQACSLAVVDELLVSGGADASVRLWQPQRAVRGSMQPAAEAVVVGAKVNGIARVPGGPPRVAVATVADGIPVLTIRA